MSAELLARELLADERPNRWRHVLAVGERTALFCHAHERRTFKNLLAAGFVHDIGYADEVRDTGFHPIDGARHLRQLGFDEDIVGLVAYHTCAHIEADLRGLRRVLSDEFPHRPELPHDELLYCDLTTGPTGETTTVEGRLAEVKARYGPSDVVHRFITIAEPQLLAAARRAEAKLRPLLPRQTSDRTSEPPFGRPEMSQHAVAVSPPVVDRKGDDRLVTTGSSSTGWRGFR